MSSLTSSTASSQRPSVPTTREDVRNERARRSLAEFVKQAWDIVEPGTPLAWNWHLDVVCEALERQTLGDPEYRKLLICIPPGSMKSLLVSVFQPAWQWLRQPERRKLFISNDDDLTIRDSRRTREIITSDWYQGLMAYCERLKGREPWHLAHDQNEKVNFANTRHGFRQCRSVGGKITGKRADDLVIDDPIDAKDVVNGSIDQIRKRLKDANNVIEKVLPSRVNNLAEARWTIIMQRLHEDDPAGRAMAEGDWKVINIQMEYDPENPLNHPRDREERENQGDLMFPGLFPRQEIDKLKVKLGNHWFSQYQQDPRPAEASVLKRWYWCFWYPKEWETPPPPVVVRLPDGSFHECRQEKIPETLFNHRQSWDMAFKDTKDSAYVVGQVWAERGANSYLLDQMREKLDINGSLDAVRTLSAKWPQALEKLIEDKANGPAVIRILRDEIPGLVDVNPEGGKETRMNAAAPMARAGNLWLPHPSVCPWVHAFIDEAEAAPYGAYMDQVDSCTQYVIYRYGDGAGFLDQMTTM